MVLAQQVAVLPGLVPSFFPPENNPLDADLDADGLPDGWERVHGLNEFVHNASADFDFDGLNDLQEFQRGTSPIRSDTDGDGLSDSVEVLTHSTNPLSIDSDGDGFSDSEEVAQGTNPLDDSSNPGVNTGSVLFNPFRRLNVAGARGTGGGRNGFYGVGQGIALSTSVNQSFQSISPLGWQTQAILINPRTRDSDQDGLPDWWEETYGQDSLVNDSTADPDGDGLGNLQEYALSTNPVDTDTDGDGFSDFIEVNTHSSDPLLVDSDGDGFSDLEEVSSGNYPISGSDYPGVVVSTFQASGYQIGAFGGCQTITEVSSFSSGGGSFS